MLTADVARPEEPNCSPPLPGAAASRSRTGPDIVFGPVPSRRLGRSLGINNIPPKSCSYSCVYCQAGRTDRLSAERRSFFPPGAVIAAVEARLEVCRHAGEQVDYASFVPDGEPTLDVALGDEIRGVKALQVRVAVITNGSLLWRDDVRADLAAADWVSVKVDAVEMEAWRRINRPARSLDLGRVLDGVSLFAANRTAILVSETMLVAGVNDDDRSLRATASFLSALRPATAYISAPIRPPAEASASVPPVATLDRARRIFSDAGLKVGLLVENEAGAFAAAEDARGGLLAIIAVHPMSEAAVREYLARANADWSVVDRLVSTGQAVVLEHRGQLFFALPARRGARNSI